MGKKLKFKNALCMKSGCEAWEAALGKREFKDCERCGFNYTEDKRRKEIPLTLCRDGKLRKLLKV